MNWNKSILGGVCEDWKEFLEEEWDKKYFSNILKFLNENKNLEIYPKSTDVFNMFKLTSLKNTKVVILGQDPYHGFNQAHGLSFSVKKTTKLPPSLKNILKELENDLGETKASSDLSSWAKQGVLLLNNTLTVFANKSNSHKNIGWNTFTDNLIKHLDEKIQPIFVLWGVFANKKAKLIKHSFILKSSHPSPLSSYRGFFNSKPFSKINKILEEKNQAKIKW